MATSNILRGTMLLTGAIFLSKLLGMIYVIPFEMLVGERGATLFNYAYNPYNIFLSISTVGVPLAVSKFVSKYNSLGDYETGRRIFKAGITLMAGTGLLAFLVLFFSAELLANLYVAKETEVNSIENVTMVIRMVSFALLVIPAMSIVRGFFQGYESMGPTALSQVVEQIVRIIFLLISAYIVIHVFNGKTATAVGFATFATFIGALASCVVLFFYWRRRKSFLNKQLQKQEHSYNLPLKDLFKELFRYAGPFVLVGIATSLYQQIDLLTFNRAMVAIGLGDMVDTVLGGIHLYAHKLVIIPVTLATGLSLAMLPAITKSFTDQNKPQMFRQMNQSFQIIVLFVLPAAVGLSILSWEAYGALYGVKGLEIFGPLLGWYAPMAILFAFFTVSSSVLQGINQQKFTVVSLTAGLLLKGFLNIPFIQVFGAKGAIFTTMIAVFAAVALNLWRIKITVHFPFHQFIRRSMLIAIFTVIMSIVVLVTKWLADYLINFQNERLELIVILILSVLTGAGVYFWFSYQSTLLERVLGDRVKVLDKFMKRRKV